MTVGELREYLAEYKDDEGVGFFIMNNDEEKAFPVRGYDFLKDEKDGPHFPVIFLEIVEGVAYSEMAAGSRPADVSGSSYPHEE